MAIDLGIDIRTYPSGTDNEKRLAGQARAVLFIFTIGAVVIKNLNTIVVNHNLINEQDIIIGKYNEMLFQMKGAQAELFRHQAGYTRNIEDQNYIGTNDEIFCHTVCRPSRCSLHAMPYKNRGAPHLLKAYSLR